MRHTLKYLIIFLLFSCSKENAFVSVPSISSFTLQEFQGRDVEIKDNQITVFLPFGALIKNLTTKVETQNTVEIIPKPGTPQDFSKPVYYTLIGEHGTKVIYTVKVNLESQPMPIISFIEKDTTEAGLTNIINGKYFGNFAYGVKANLVNSQGDLQELPFKLLDSTKIEIQVPISTKVGNYKVKVKVNTLDVVSNTILHVSYPAPQIGKLSHANILNNDTLWITGSYLDSNYKFSAIFKNNFGEFELPNVSKKSNFLGFVPKNLLGNFEVYLKNISSSKISRSKEFSFKCWDSKLPFISKIIGTKSGFKKGETIQFETINFELSPARFFQVQLKNSQKTYIQNGLYSNGILSVILPENILKGNYSMGFLLSNSEKNYNYMFENDIVVEILESN